MCAESQKTDLFRADDVRVVDGLMMGGALGAATNLHLDDVYQLDRDAKPLHLRVDHDRAGNQFTLAGCKTTLHPDASLHFLCQDGWTFDAILLSDDGGAVFLLPLAPLQPGKTYRLLDHDPRNAAHKFAQATGACFAAGTPITLANGKTRLIEDLQPGDMVQTRDHGPQGILGSVHRTLRAQGGTAPVILNHDNSAVAAHPAQGLCLGRGTTPAARLVDDQQIKQHMGGFVDYVQLHFDTPCQFMVGGFWATSHLTDLRSDTLCPAARATYITVGEVMRLVHSDIGAERHAANTASPRPAMVMAETKSKVKAATQP